MKAVLSGGGTAGHINPALALAEELSRRGWEVLFAGTPAGVEAKLVSEAGIPFRGFKASGFNRRKPLSLIKGVAAIQKSTGEAKRWFKEIEPDVVVGFGGYVCVPVGRAAESLGIPVAVHEQNSVMGMANRYLARRAAAICLTYEHAASALDEGERRHVVLTGNPVRSSVLTATRAAGRAMLGIPEDARMLLVTGGSLGARHVNQAVMKLKEELLSRRDLYVVHLTGRREFEAVKSGLALTEGEALRWRVIDYQDRMGDCMAAADAIVSRAGASSLAEISALAVPALLVPFPAATEDHQTMNARAYVEAGCAYLVPDAEVETPLFAEKLLRLLDDAEERKRMREAARAQKTQDAAAKLADAVIAAANGR